MPIKKVAGGFKVQNKKQGGFLSKKPLSKAKALAQLRAVKANQKGK